MATIVATPGSATANCYLTHAEANAYFAERLPLASPWRTTGQEAVLIMATRTLDALMLPGKRLVRVPGQDPYYVQRRTWAGLPASTAQRLAWPRVGMLTRNGAAILPTVIPEELKFAVAEFAGQLRLGDRTLDSDVIVQGLKSLSAGPVSMAFTDGLLPQVVPDAVLNLLLPSWMTDEEIVSSGAVEFEVV